MMSKAAIVKVIFILFLSLELSSCQRMPINILEPNLDLITKDTKRSLGIPKRLENAIGGSPFAKQIADLNIKDREKAMVKEILSGNIPSFSRQLKPLKVTKVIDGKNYELIFFTTYDYLAIGSNEDYLYTPMTPATAQYLADKVDCSLPTKEMVDVIYNKATIKLSPQPIPPSDSMTTLPVFKQHTDSIEQQIGLRGLDRSGDNIIAGHKKDIIISNKIYSTARPVGSVVIYGWHLGIAKPIQPVYNGHHAGYADYSHGVRLISKLAFINGDSIFIEDLLKNPNLSVLLSSEGVIKSPSYPASNLFIKR